MTHEEQQALDDLLAYCGQAIARKFQPKEPKAPEPKPEGKPE
jgi:hypothetical protein